MAFILVRTDVFGRKISYAETLWMKYLTDIISVIFSYETHFPYDFQIINN